METRHYNTWLFSDVATRRLHQITSDTAIMTGRGPSLVRNFSFHFDSIMSYSTDSELDIVNPNPVRAHTNYSVAQKTKEKRKRDHSSSIDAETRAKQSQNVDFYAEKSKLFCKFCLFEWIIPGNLF